MQKKPFPMGVIIAERQIFAYEKSGEKRLIVVRLGAPIQMGPSEKFPVAAACCPLQVQGLNNDDKVYPVLGGDAFEAMQYAIDFAGDLLSDGMCACGSKTEAGSIHPRVITGSGAISRLGSD
jgi:hypothetical protein